MERMADLIPSPAPVLSLGDVEAYLARIDHPPVQVSDLATLSSLQDAHVRSVPFENLDIHLGVPLSLEISDLVDKVVGQHRGGFCFELNGLFCALLVALGYDAHLVEARSREADGELGPRFDHARIVVRGFGAPRVVDVGSGASPRVPLAVGGVPQDVGGGRLSRIVVVDGRWDSQAREDEGWVAGWSSDPTPRALADFAERCVHHQTSPDSHFTAKPLAALVTTDGHVTLAGRQRIETRHGERSESTADDPLAVLASDMNLTIPRWPDERPSDVDGHPVPRAPGSQRK